LSRRTGFTYRLPSASEWEYMAAAGNEPGSGRSNEKISACSVANIADQAAREVYPGWKISNCNDANVHTAPVAGFNANAFGIHDSLGNVFEWVLDCWNPNYAGAPQDGSAWFQGDCSQRELRGGSWFSQPAFLSHRFRNRLPTRTRTSSIGFRVVRELRRIEE